VTGLLLFASVLPHDIMHGPWFAALSMFVAINTVLYLTLAIVKLLPKAYLSDWIDQRTAVPNLAASTPMATPEPRDSQAPASALHR
jgi:hypothetical protein